MGIYKFKAPVSCHTALSHVLHDTSTEEFELLVGTTKEKSENFEP